jgi:rod shape-determining protein MreC
MYRKQVRRRRAILVLLVVACLVLISSHFSEGESGPLHVAQNGVGSVMAPLEEGANRALKPFRDMVNWFDETFDARGENEQLQEENADLREQLAETRSKLERGIEARKVAEVAAQPALAGFDRVDATVRVRSPTQWNETVVIDKGSSDGIAVDDAVMTGEGLVGRVSQVNGGSARVLLITGRDSAVTARVAGVDTVGLIKPQTGNPSELLFTLIDNDQEIEDGDELVTAGFSDDELSSVFPADIPIGKINQDAAGLESGEDVHVIPSADLTDLDDVTVLTGGGT